MTLYHFALNGSLVTIDLDLVSSAQLQPNNSAAIGCCDPPPTLAAVKCASASSGRERVERPPAVMRRVIWEKEEWVIQ